MTAPVFLIDVAAYLHRAMYVIHGDGASTASPDDDSFARHACGMLAGTMEKIGIERMAVVADSTELSFRCDEYPAYKAERKPHTPVFAKQMPRFFTALREISVCVASAPRYEADDLIATLLGQEVGTRYQIVSSDKDLLCWLGEARGPAGFYDPMKGQWATPALCREKFGVEPRQLHDYIALVGDTSDGIPGVPGVGAKTAARLLCEFGDIASMYERVVALEEYAGSRQYKALMAHKDLALLSLSLAQPRYCESLHLVGDAFNAPSPSIVRRAMDAVT